MEKEPSDPDQEFVYAAFEVLSLDEISVIFSNMDPLYIVQMCSYLKERCDKIKWTNVLRKVTGNDFLKANYQSVESLAYMTASVQFDLLWPKNDRDPRNFQLKPKLFDEVTSEDKQKSVRIIVLVLAPRNSIVRRWIMVQWSDFGAFQETYNKYENALIDIESRLYSIAERDPYEDVVHGNPEQLFNVLQKAGSLASHPDLSREEFVADPLVYIDGGYFSPREMKLFHKLWFKIPSTKELEKIFNGGQGYYEHRLGSFSVAHATFHRD